MPTVIHQLADAFLKRKQAMSEGKRAKSVLPGSDYFMPKSAKQDLANRLSVFEQGGLPELLKQGASEMYRNPIVNTAISLTPGAGDVQSGYEAVQSAKEGNWGEAGLNALGVLPFVPSMGMIGKTVWHGSPHTFDKFDLSKIGTGEGAQAYGHGLYLAEARPVAEEYAQTAWHNLKDAPKAEFSGKPVEINSMGNVIGDYPKPLKSFLSRVTSKGDFDAAIKEVSSTLDEMKRTGSFPSIQDDLALELETALANKDKIKASGISGQLYKVDLPDEQIAKMLDWDKPLSEQPKNVRNALGDIASTIAKQSNEQRMLLNQQNPERLTHPVIGKLAQKESFAEDVAGNKLHEYLARELGGSEKVSEYLRQQGIPGIQYLDQASRGAGEGTRNYVVFSDEIPKILERNGTSVFEFPKD